MKQTKVDIPCEADAGGIDGYEKNDPYVWCSFSSGREPNPDLDEAFLQGRVKLLFEGPEDTGDQVQNEKMTTFAKEIARFCINTFGLGKDVRMIVYRGEWYQGALRQENKA